MQRRPKRGANAHGGSLAKRCVLFWAAPIVFLLLATARLSVDAGADEGLPGVARGAVPALLVVTLPSVVNFGADCFFRCQGSLQALQLFAQALLVMLYFSFEVPGMPHATPLAARKVPRQAAAAGPPILPGAAVKPALAERPALADKPALAEAAMDPETISVVLPCLNESGYAAKTVQSFCDRTPMDVLQEIIVVDDGSAPPLKGLLEKVIDKERCRLTVLTHGQALGLMIAKQTGGDASKGKYIGFFDCHVAPRMGWERELISLLREKPRRLVIPMIGDLNVTAWDEKVPMQLVTKCYITWNAEFWWYDDDSNFVPVISGGLVATSRDWWRESGGYDGEMRGWGGENTDQSLRAWLCGGDIVRAKSSVISHMWRIQTDQRTMAKYRLRTHTDNNARVAAMWYGDFAFKFRGGYLNTKQVDVSFATRLQSKLDCKPYVYFLHRFRSVYLRGGMLPDEVFRIRLRDTEECLQKVGKKYVLKDCKKGTWFHAGNQIPKGFPTRESLSAVLSMPDEKENDQSEVVCGGHRAKTCRKCPQGNGAGWCHGDCSWVFGDCLPQEQAKTLKFMQSGVCCSGIREWNSIDCFDELKDNGPRASYCDVSGSYSEQHYIFEESGLIRHNSGKCVSASEHGTLKPADCAQATRWDRIQSFLPEETKLYHRLVKKHGLTEDMPDH